MTKLLRYQLFCWGLICMALLPQKSSAQYCTPTYSFSCTSGDYIDGFSTTGGITNISNSSTGCSNSAGYSHFSTKTHTQVLGGSVTFSVYTGSWSQYINIYVDWNQDGDFTDAGEQVWTSGTTKVTSTGSNGSFTVPLTATVGVTRMRVRCVYSGTVDPCSSSSFGETEDYNFESLSPCTAVSGLSSSDVYARSAKLNWAAVTGSTGYEYVVKTTSANPTGNGTPVSANSVAINNLQPATTYYAFVRNICNPTSKSQWSVINFTTSNCVAPQLGFANITSNSATALWSSLSIATQYEYVYGTDPTPPSSTATTTITTGNSFHMPNLLPETTYYVHIRTYCIGNEMSGYETYQFNTMPDCDAPSITKVEKSPVDMEATWPEVNTAVAYEYAVNSSETGPSLGKTIYVNTVAFSIPNDNKPYYLHVRTKCVSIYSVSDWATVTLREPSETSIADVNNEGMLLTAYPNPATATVTVKVNGALAEGEMLTITDVSGRVVYSNPVNTSSVAIDMKDMAAGIYLVKYAGQVVRLSKQ